MKRQLSLMLLGVFTFSGIIQAQTTNPAPYCDAQIVSYSFGYDNMIKKVAILTLENNSGDDYLNESEYAYYNSIEPVNLQKGVDIPAAITVSKNDIELNSCWIFIDYNLNNAFEETELVAQVPQSQLDTEEPGDVDLSFNINIPLSAQTGQTRMRIIYTSNFMLPEPATSATCSFDTEEESPVFYYGEIEDYEVNLTAETITSIDENLEAQVLVYPNPGRNYFHVESAVAGKLTICNLTGEKILEQHTEAGKNMLDLSAQPAGIYFMQVQQGQLQKMFRLVKE